MIDQFTYQEDVFLTDLVRYSVPRRFQTVGFYVRVFAMYVIPLVLSPLLRISTHQSHGAFIVLYVLFLWLFQSIPPAIVSTLPIVLVPTFMGVSAEVLMESYSSETMLLYIAYALVVNGVEATNLHKRLILTLLLVFGGKTGFIIGGFVTTTIAVSMWTNAVKTTAIVLPIAMEAIQHIQDNRLFHVFELRTRYIHKRGSIGTPIMEARYLIEGGIVIPDVIRILSEFFTVKKGLLIGICYSAVLGSMGSVVGCGGNLFVKAFMEQMYNYRRFTIYKWVQCHMPVIVLCAFLLWIMLSVFYSSDVMSSDNISKRAFEDIIYKHFAKLGTITYTEVATMLTMFAMAIAIVMCHFYAEEVEGSSEDLLFNETMCVITSAIILYAVPRVAGKKPKAGKRCRVHNVNMALKKISWAFVITMGAGVCVARLIVSNHLHTYFEPYLPHRIMSAPFALQVVVACAALVLAEINNSLNNIIIFAPLIAHMSDVAKVHAMYLLMPFTFCSYFGFVVATATTVSEYVADFGDLQEVEFILPGIIMKIGCTLIVLLAYNTWCYDYFFLYDELVPLVNSTVREKGM